MTSHLGFWVTKKKKTHAHKKEVSVAFRTDKSDHMAMGGRNAKEDHDDLCLVGDCGMKQPWAATESKKGVRERGGNLLVFMSIATMSPR